MRRNLACFAAVSLLAIGGAACTGGNSTGHSAAHHKLKNTRTTDVIGRPQAANLVMARGRSSARYVITAPSPARYAFDVSVAARASTDVAVKIRTWYGAIFPSILISSHEPGTCRLRGSQDLCSEHFPLLPSERAGAWTVIAAKRAGPATTVRIAVTFAKP